MKFNFNLEDIKYIKIMFNEESGFRSLKAAVKSINEREITANAKYEEDIEVKTPLEITLSVVCSDGLYCTRTVLKSFEKDEPYMFLALVTPQGMEYQQNREYFRVPVKYDVVYFSQVEGEIKRIEAKAVNLSANGICIFTQTEIISDNDSEMVINIAEKQVSTLVKYIRSEKIENGYKTSFSFSKILESDRDYLSQVCIQTQLELKRNSIM